MRGVPTIYPVGRGRFSAIIALFGSPLGGESPASAHMRKGLCGAQSHGYYLSNMQIDQKIGIPPFPRPARKIQIGGLALDGVVLLAPMSGVTDVVMRRLAGRLGTAGVVSEMIASPELARSGEEARLRLEGEGVSPHIVQIAGRDPECMGQAARIATSTWAVPPSAWRASFAARR